MSSIGSVTVWLHQLQGGDRAALEPLWERYFLRLLGFARRKLPSGLAAWTEEDVALDAFASFWRGVDRGRFPDLVSRDNLWRLLVVITARKVCHLVRDEGRRPIVQRPAVLDQIPNREPDPEFQAQAAEQLQRLLETLGDESLESVARLRLEGYTTREVAERLGCSPRTVERKLLLIQGLWAAEVKDD